jgi:hypothetical protein
LDDDLVFGDHGWTHRVDPAFEHVGFDLRRVQLIYIAPTFSDEVRLVAIELKVPVSGPGWAATPSTFASVCWLFSG